MNTEFQKGYSGDFPESIENHSKKKYVKLKRKNTSLVAMKTENYGK